MCPNCLARRAAGTENPEVNSAPPDGTITVTSSDVVAIGSTVAYFGDYELLQEIARGGMGVIYKARQASLNRLVAVKMILAGHLASEAEVKRFHTEAEAAANLQHPNIVAIHEVGHHQGQHYFSMDYVEGKDLAAVAKEHPLSAARAAGCVKTIAEAVHYAHQRGTLHRDLKPQNILLDSDGQPRITDFGLAKRFQQDSKLTVSGAVIGTPAYMPPEQAAGRLDQVGPQSDVYSLGAILYHLLTGRPPFRGETPVETLRRVMDDEPLRPSKLNGKVPSDLETICLKCLEKRPERRYPSARELAEELGRFLDHRPILARPASRSRQAVAWCRRNPWALTGAAAVLILGLAGLAFGLWEYSRFIVWRNAHPGVRAQLDSLDPWAGLQVIGWNLGLIAMLVLYFRLDPHRRQHQPVPRALTRASLAVGTGLFVLGLSSYLTAICMLAWGRSSPEVGPLAALAFLASWSGLILLWQTIQHQEVFWFDTGDAEAQPTSAGLQVNWAGLLVALLVQGALSWLAGRALVSLAFRIWPELVPNPGGFPRAAIAHAAVETDLVNGFVLAGSSVAVLWALVVAGVRAPRGPWRELSPLGIAGALIFAGVGCSFLPTVLVGPALVWGWLSWLVLIKSGKIKVVERPKLPVAPCQESLDQKALRAVRMAGLGWGACAWALLLSAGQPWLMVLCVAAVFALWGLPAARWPHLRHRTRIIWVVAGFCAVCGMSRALYSVTAGWVPILAALVLGFIAGLIVRWAAKPSSNGGAVCRGTTPDATCDNLRHIR